MDIFLLGDKSAELFGRSIFPGLGPDVDSFFLLKPVLGWPSSPTPLSVFQSPRERVRVLLHHKVWCVQLHCPSELWRDLLATRD